MQDTSLEVRCVVYHAVKVRGIDVTFVDSVPFLDTSSLYYLNVYSFSASANDSLVVSASHCI